MSRKSGKPTRPWEKIAQQITQEHDPDELLALAEKLNEAMLTEEREKVQRRSGIVADSRLA